MTNLTNNKAVLSWIDEMTAITKPDKIVWITGEEEQLGALREQAVKEGILIKLNPDKLPGCYLHRTDPDDVARVEDRTFICCEKEEDAGPTNHWVEPKEMYERMYALADGAYKGRTMYIIPYSMSIIGSPFAKYGFELTDSIYVVLNMHIMTRIGKAVCDALGDDEGFIKGLHCQCNLDKDNKYIVHFPQDNTIISMNSNYGGNVLQGKKCFALRIASNLGRQEGWMAEHMLILGIQNPRGEIKYISAAFPSACGKTNLAMLIPPEGLQRWGWRVWCVGDDIAWLRVGKDGRLWAVNPENGFFGVAPGTSMKSNPNALISTHKDTIFTNVALDLSDNTVWWEGLNKTPPARAIDWRGRPWTPQSPEKAAHPIAQLGRNVSGGQKQRLSIARALARKPEILIFDDSFSALDYKTDAVLREGLAKQLPGTTKIIVAQRISTIHNADQILVLDRGEIAGLGTHDELMVSCPVYREIAMSQLSEEELKKGGVSK